MPNYQTGEDLLKQFEVSIVALSVSFFVAGIVLWIMCQT